LLKREKINNGQMVRGREINKELKLLPTPFQVGVHIACVEVADFHQSRLVAHLYRKEMDNQSG